MKRANRILLTIFIIAMALESQSHNTLSKGTKVNKSDNSAFAEVIEDSLLSFSCTPKIDDDKFLGLVIAAPDEVKFKPGYSDPLTGSFARIIVCGAYRLKEDMPGLEGSISRNIEIVAVDLKSNQTFKGQMPGPRNEVPDPSGASNKSTKGSVIGGYFNPNLARFLPEKSATYKVQAQVGPVRSNEVIIRVVAE